MRHCPSRLQICVFKEHEPMSVSAFVVFVIFSEGTIKKKRDVEFINRCRCRFLNRQFLNINLSNHDLWFLIICRYYHGIKDCVIARRTFNFNHNSDFFRDNNKSSYRFTSILMSLIWKMWLNIFKSIALICRMRSLNENLYTGCPKVTVHGQENC